MPKKKKKRRKPPHRHRPPASTAGRTRAVPPPPRSAGEPDLLHDVRRALHSGDAYELLGLASTLLAVTDPRRAHPFAREEPIGPSREELVESFLDIDVPETSALLTAIAPMLGDELASRRVRRELDRRSHRLPAPVAGLNPIQVGTPIRVSHVLGDGDSYLLPVRTRAGEDLTVLVYVDHDLGTVAKDGFVAPVTAQETLDRLGDAAGGDPDTTFTPVDPAHARAVIAEAIEFGAHTYPPFETDTWPNCRPLVEWVVGELPAGGSGHRRPEWTDADRAALVDRFLASPHGTGHDDATARDQLDWLLWFGCDYGPGDPLRWSATRVEMLLADWVPRKIVAPVEALEGIPDVLRDLVRFGHAEAGIRAGLTDETLAGVDRWEPEYQRAIRQPRPQGPGALLASMGLLDDHLADPGVPAWPVDEPFDLPPPELLGLVRLAEQVGGPDELDELDDTPLPDEPFDHAIVPGDPPVAERVAEVLELLDGANDRFFDIEHRTACRRLLAEVTAADPRVLVRGRAETAAAALVWLVAKANDSFGSWSGGLTVGEVTDWFGIRGTVSQRASTFLAALGVEVPYRSASWATLGSPDYLTGAKRRRLMTTRDRILATLT